MTALQHLAVGRHYGVHLPEPDDFDLWRERARALVEADIPPDRVAWSEPGGAGDLFALEGPANAALRLPVPPRDRPPVRASRSVPPCSPASGWCRPARSVPSPSPSTCFPPTARPVTR